MARFFSLLSLFKSRQRTKQAAGIAIASIIILQASGASAVRQDNYRWRNDDGGITLGTQEIGADVALVDAANGYVYIGGYAYPPIVSKISIAPRAKFRLEYGLKSGTCSAVADWKQVPATAGSEHWVMADSVNLIDGAATTNSAGVSDHNVSFKAGETKDTASETSEISLGESQFSELEYSVRATDNAVSGGNYCFRLTNAGSATNLSATNYAEAKVLP